MLYNALPWPTWGADLPPDYTLMMPVSLRSESAYNTSVPAIHREAMSVPPSTPLSGQAEAVGIGAEADAAQSSVGERALRELRGRPAGVGGTIHTTIHTHTRNPLFAGSEGSSAAVSSAGIELRSVPFSAPDSSTSSSHGSHSSSHSRGARHTGRAAYTRLSGDAGETGSARGSSHGLLTDVDLDEGNNSNTGNSNRNH
jgi:hypothetical protein